MGGLLGKKMRDMPKFGGLVRPEEGMAMGSKLFIESMLCRFPKFYGTMLRMVRRRNSEKLAFLTLIRNGDSVLDIGANFGVYTVLFSNIVGRAGAVHAFEPVPPTFVALSRRVKREQRFKNIFLNNVGLSEERGTFEMEVPSGDFGQASLRQHSVGSWSKGGREKFKCGVRTLDDYADENRLKEIHFIKLDIEGGEFLALKGGAGVLRRSKPVIHLEFFPAWTKAFGYSAEDLLEFLRSFGYIYLYRNDMSNLEETVAQLDASLESQNIVCSTNPLVK